MEEINLKELWGYIWSKFYILIITLGICLTIGNVYLFYFQKPLYKSTTTLVLVNEENTQNSITQSDVTLNNNLVSTYSEIIKSRTVLSKVKENLKLKDNVDTLYNSISVSSVTNTQLIKIDVKRHSNHEAQDIANNIATVFSEEIKDIYKIQNISVVDKAQISQKPCNKNIIKQNILYFICGVILSFIIILILYYLDTSIKDNKIIEDKLNLTVFGIVPKVGGNYGSRL